MRVLCLSKQDFTGGQALDLNIIEVGEVYVVAYECLGYGKNNSPVDCYCLVEFAHTEYVFDQRNFATLPDEPAEIIDEQELVEALA